MEVEEVRDRKGLIGFITMAKRLYRDDPNWVSPLVVDQLRFFDKERNPFFKHADTVFFVVKDNVGRIVGRIATTVDHRHNEIHNEKAGFFGFFETIRDPKVYTALFEAASSWLKEQGMETIKGPFSLSINHECGLLIDGFDDPPVIMMPYNPPWYAEVMEKLGFEKAKDLFAFWMDAYRELPETLYRVADRIERRSGVEVRSMRMGEFEKEIERFAEIYNSAWEENWGFVPLDEDEIEFMAKRLRPIIKPDLVIFIEKNGTPVATSISLPDYNQVLRRLKGSLFPFGICKLMLYSRHISRARMVAMGVKKEWRHKGLELLLCLSSLKAGRGLGYRGGELSWTLEDNHKVNSLISKDMGATLYKRYRIYERAI